MPVSSACSNSNCWNLCGISNRQNLVIFSAGLTLATQVFILIPAAPAMAGRAEPCIQMRRTSARISRRQLEIVMQLRRGALWEEVVQVIGTPYCQLDPTTDAPRRDAYPLAFDPSTWLVLEYDRAVTFQHYDFTFNNRQPGGF